MKAICVTALLAVVTMGVAVADPKAGLQDPANPIKPEPPPPPSKPDPVVTSSEMHGIESTQRHQGMNFTFALGGSLTVGVGIDSSVGRGPSVSVRLAHMATDRLAFNAELASTTLLHKVQGMDGSSGPTKKDLSNSFMIGPQLFLNRVLWVRIGGGVGSFAIDQGDNKNYRVLPGVSGVGGAGLDLVRFKRTAIGLEWMTVGMITRDGLLTTTAFMLDLSIE